MDQQPKAALCMSGLQGLQGRATGQVMQLAGITRLELSKPRQVLTCGYSIMDEGLIVEEKEPVSNWI